MLFIEEPGCGKTMGAIAPAVCVYQRLRSEMIGKTSSAARRGAPG